MAKSAKPAKTSVKAPAKAATVTLRHLSAALAEKHNLPKKQANEVLADMVDMITSHLKKGARLRIGGLGILQVRKRPARMGRKVDIRHPPEGRIVHLLSEMSQKRRHWRLDNAETSDRDPIAQVRCEYHRAAK